MMAAIYVRKVPYIVGTALCRLLAFATSSSAHCAWVMWSRIPFTIADKPADTYEPFAYFLYKYDPCAQPPNPPATQRWMPAAETPPPPLPRQFR